MSTTVCQRVQPQFGYEPWRIQLQFPSRCSPRHASAENSALGQNSKAQLQDTGKNEVCDEYAMKDSSASKNGNFGGWSFLQALSNPTQSSKNENDKVYVHPLAKLSSSALSEKSLEMCTESLGSETGSTISDNGDDLIASYSIFDNGRSTRMPCYTSKKPRPSYIANFPPTISSCGVQVKSVREDGRLVIKAVSVGTPRTCFEAERRDGRLKLLFLPGSSMVSRNDVDQNEGILDFEQEDEANEDDYDNDDVNDGEVDENMDCL